MKVLSYMQKSLKASMLVLAISAIAVLSLKMGEHNKGISNEEPFAKAQKVFFQHRDDTISYTNSAKSGSSIKGSAIMIGLPSLR